MSPSDEKYNRVLGERDRLLVEVRRLTAERDAAKDKAFDNARIADAYAERAQVAEASLAAGHVDVLALDRRVDELRAERDVLLAKIAELGTVDQLAELVALVSRATEGPWQFGQPKVTTEAEAIDWFRHAYRGGPEGSFWTNWVPDTDPQRPGDSSLFVAITGNGPTSEANARFISMARSVLPLLLAKVRALVEASR